MNEEQASSVGEAISETTQAVVDTTVKTAQDIASTAGDTIVNVTQGVTKETRSLLHLDDILKYFTLDNLIHVVTSLLAILIFYIAYRVIKRVLNKRIIKNVKPATATLINKFISYAFWILILMHVLGLFGIKLSAIWGAAGVAGLAIGFAAQTSVSNVISGVFVLGEKALKPGDFISTGGVSGTVDSVGILSVVIHTPDNQMIRIPNSSIINGTLTNFSYFNKRRLTIEVGVAYDSDMDLVQEALERVPSLCPSALKDPAPLVFFDGLGDSSVNLKVCIWCDNPNLIALKNEAYKAIIRVSREAPFEIPFNKLDVTLLDSASKANVTLPSSSRGKFSTVSDGVAAAIAAEDAKKNDDDDDDDDK